ncbi:MAG: adenylate cyclase [Parasphingorhabdus sp.]|jgi:adenylate cyclase
MSNDQSLPRKLAAILHADVVGFSRLTGDDEEDTYRQVRQALDRITVQVNAHNGRVVNYAGDAVLADFSSALDAVNCAVVIQNEMSPISENDRNKTVPLRIGINLGDVISVRDNIFGDGMTEDLITNLSKISGVLVIARNSVFAYKGQAVNIPSVARELGVRYILEGSISTAGNQIRVNA